MSRDQRANLLDDSDHAAYSDLGGGDERVASGGLSAWWRDPRKRLYIIGGSITVLVIIIAVAIFAVLSRSKSEPDTPPVTPSSSSSSTGGMQPAGSSSTGGYFPPYNPATPWLFPRLPNSTVPSHYDLLEIIDLKAFTFRGSVNITVNILEPVDHILLHAAPGLQYDSVSLKLSDNSYVAPTPWYYQPGQYIVLNFTESVQPQTGAVIHVGFSASLLATPYAGLYSAYYINPARERVFLATTQFEAADARRAFPCFDEPGLKATFSITIQNQQEWSTVLSNMPATATTNIGSGWIQTVFPATPVMSTYLVAFVVSDFVYSSAQANCTGVSPVTTRVFAPPHLLNYTRIPVQIAASIMQYYCQYFDMPYPLPKEDHIAIPQFAAGAMENWGLVTYANDALLLNPNYFDVDQLQWVATVIAHELAHQWFGNLVTAAWWSQLWLNEGFATFVEYLGAGDALPALSMKDQFLLIAENNALTADAYPDAVPVVDETTIEGNFDYTVYDKGGSLLRMLEGVLGPAVFRAGVEAYLKQYQYKNVMSNDLFVCLTQAATQANQPMDVVEFMAEWTQQPGYPLVNCTATPVTTPSSVGWTCNQKRYFAYPQRTVDNSTWTIYLTAANNYAPFGSPQGVRWGKDQTQYTFVQPSTTPFVKLNANSTGFFRVMYDEYGWQQLSRALDTAGFSGMQHDDRLGLVMDAYEFSDQGWMSAGQFLNLTRFLRFDTSWAVWSMAAPDLISFDYIISARNDTAVLTAAYRGYLDRLWLQVAQSLNTSNLDTIRDRRLYEALSLPIVMYDAGQRREEFHLLFGRLQDGSRQVRDISPDELTIVLRSGLAVGGVDALTFIMNNYYVPLRNSTSPNADNPLAPLSTPQILYAAGSSQDDQALGVFLSVLAYGNYSGTPLTLAERVNAAIFTIRYNEMGRRAFTRYITTPGAFDAFYSTMPPFAFGFVLQELMVAQYDVDQIIELFYFFNSTSQVAPAVVNDWRLGTAVAILYNVPLADYIVQEMTHFLLPQTTTSHVSSGVSVSGNRTSSSLHTPRQASAASKRMSTVRRRCTLGRCER